MTTTNSTTSTTAGQVTATGTQATTATRTPTSVAPTAPHRISRFGLINCYLVSEPDGLTLIDTTIGGAAKAILAAVREAGAPLRRIVLTHAHGDHIGSLDALHAQVPEAEVIISTRDARLLAKDTSLDPDEPRTKLKGTYSGAKTKPTRTVTDGDEIGSLKVIATPGHTPGHISLLDRRDGTLYCGDVFTTLGTVATSAKGPWYFPLAQFGTWDKAIDVESAQRLIFLHPARLAPGHGPVIDSPGAGMLAAVQRGF